MKNKRYDMGCIKCRLHEDQVAPLEKKLETIP